MFLAGIGGFPQELRASVMVLEECDTGLGSADVTCQDYHGLGLPYSGKIKKPSEEGLC